MAGYSDLGPILGGAFNAGGQQGLDTQRILQMAQRQADIQRTAAVSQAQQMIPVQAEQARTMQRVWGEALPGPLRSVLGLEGTPDQAGGTGNPPAGGAPMGGGPASLPIGTALSMTPGKPWNFHMFGARPINELGQANLTQKNMQLQGLGILQNLLTSGEFDPNNYQHRQLFAQIATAFGTMRPGTYATLNEPPKGAGNLPAWYMGRGQWPGFEQPGGQTPQAGGPAAQPGSQPPFSVMPIPGTTPNTPPAIPGAAPQLPGPALGQRIWDVMTDLRKDRVQKEAAARVVGANAPTAREAAVETARQKTATTTEERLRLQQKYLGISDEDARGLAQVYAQGGQLPPLGFSPLLRKPIIEQINNLFKEGTSSPSIVLQKQAIFQSAKAELTKVSQQEGALLPFLRTARENLQRALDISDAVQRSDVPVLNRLLLPFQQEIGGATGPAMLTAGQRVAINEVARVLQSATATGGVLSDQSRREIESMMGPTMNPAQLHKVADILNADMDSRERNFTGVKQAVSDLVSTLGRPGPASPALPAVAPVLNQQLSGTTPSPPKTFRYDRQGNRIGGP